MKKLPLFNFQKMIYNGLIAIMLLFLFGLFLQTTSFSTSISVSIGIIIASAYHIITHANQIKKYYFIIEKGAIRWKMLAMEKESIIQLKGKLSNIKQDWKGIHFNDDEEQHSIMTDGLTKTQKEIIIKGLEDYPSLLS